MLDIRGKWFSIKIYFKNLIWPHNYLKIKTLGRSWQDQDTKMAHAMFQILSDFLEYEITEERISWQSYELQSIYKEMQTLDKWWKEVYLKFDAFEDYDATKASSWEQKFIKKENGYFNFEINGYEKEFFDIANARTMEMDKTLDENLTRLIEIRAYMWT